MLANDTSGSNSMIYHGDDSLHSREEEEEEPEEKQIMIRNGEKLIILPADGVIHHIE